MAYFFNSYKFVSKKESLSEKNSNLEEKKSNDVYNFHLKYLVAITYH